jgi:hypothetical protein
MSVHMWVPFEGSTAASHSLGHRGVDPSGELPARRLLNREKAAHLPPYLERNMIALRHWNPPGA